MVLGKVKLFINIIATKTDNKCRDKFPSIVCGLLAKIDCILNRFYGRNFR